MKSEQVKIGLEKAPHRALFKALGLTDEEMARPLIGIVNSHNDIVPGHINLDKIAEAVKAGVRLAGGTPMEFQTIGVCDGIAMNHIGMKYSLGSRELIADSVEIMATAHAFDALVFIPNCDKIVPGMMMAAARLNIPSIFVSGGPMLAGRVKSRAVSLTQVFEGVGAAAADRIKAEDLVDYFRIPADFRDLNYTKYVQTDGVHLVDEEYNSGNTHQLDQKEMTELLLTLDYVKFELENK